MEPFVAIQSDIATKMEPILQLQKQIYDMLAPYQKLGNQLQENFIKVFNNIDLDWDYINSINQSINASTEKYFAEILSLQNPTSYKEIRTLSENYLKDQIKSTDLKPDSHMGNHKEISLEVSAEAVSSFSENVMEIPKDSLTPGKDNRVRIKLETVLAIINIIIILLGFACDRIEYMESSKSDAAYQKEFLALYEREIAAEEHLNSILESSTLLFPNTCKSQETLLQDSQYIQKQSPSVNEVDPEYQNKYPESSHNTSKTENSDLPSTPSEK